jgi:hypothetical protein
MRRIRFVRATRAKSRFSSPVVGNRRPETTGVTSPNPSYHDRLSAVPSELKTSVRRGTHRPNTKPRISGPSQAGSARCRLRQPRRGASGASQRQDSGDLPRSCLMTGRDAQARGRSFSQRSRCRRLASSGSQDASRTSRERRAPFARAAHTRDQRSDRKPARTSSLKS